MVKLKKVIKVAKGIYKNPDHKVRRYVKKGDRALAGSKVMRKVRKATKKVDKKLHGAAKKAGMGKEYNSVKKKAVKFSGAKPYIEGRKGILTAVRRKYVPEKFRKGKPLKKLRNQMVAKGKKALVNALR